MGILIIFILLFCITIVYGALSWGLLMYKFWSWFLLPVFPTLPNITFNQAIGLAMFIGLFHTVQTQVLKKECKDESQSIILPIITPWITLLIGWLVYNFIT